MTYSSISEQLGLLPGYLGNHLLLTLIALIAGIVICVPCGVMVTRIKSLQWPTLTIAGILQTIPGIALLAIMVPLLGRIGFLPALIALIVYSVLPILRNTVTGILGVEKSVLEAARGIGMTDMQSLFKVELPLSLPVIVAGIRTAAVWVVGTATLATPVGATSLGNYVFSGLQTQNISAIIVGCVAAALLAIVLDQTIRLTEKTVSRRNFKLAALTATILLILFAIGLAPLARHRGIGETGKTIAIGSKPFTEQYILARLIADNLSRNGFNTDIRSGMGSIILFEALANNEVDCYVDYTGTIWTNVMKKDHLPPRSRILMEMTAWLKKECEILCPGALGFENTYALAVRKETADRYNLNTIDDLSRLSNEFSMGSDYEFFSRPEWKELKDKYNLNFKELITLDPTLMYSAIAQKQVDVISAYSTDGRILDFDLMVLDDTKQALPPYDAVLLLSERASKNSSLVRILNDLVGGIDDDAMRNANKIVDVDGQSVDSAAIYLKSLIDSSGD
ncbi:MAG: ABC transporter permease/substrate-binding protein [Candidatus Zixiibacteriota bacterium]|nr:MAG: ABC transporter permease/substrate-binding protein [candidate division Zixibacteria bacterium]